MPLTMFKTKSARFLRLLNQHCHMQMAPTPDMINQAQTLMETKISPTDCDQWMGCVTRDERPSGHLGGGDGGGEGGGEGGGGGGGGELFGRVRKLRSGQNI